MQPIPISRKARPTALISQSEFPKWARGILLILENPRISTQTIKPLVNPSYNVLIIRYRWTTHKSCSPHLALLQTDLPHHNNSYNSFLITLNLNNL